MKRIILAIALTIITAIGAVAQPKNGTAAAEIALPSLDGKTLKLSSLRGKYVVVDFWASWCGPCMRGMTEMKKYYAKYKKKVEFLGVNCDEDLSAWKQAVSSAALPWKHVNTSKAPAVMKAYNIAGLPTKIIISPKGKVVYSCVGEMPEFYTKLESLLK